MIWSGKRGLCCDTRKLVFYNFCSLFFDTVYKFDENLYDWVLLEERLANPRVSAAAIAVPDNFLGCQ